MGVVKDSVVFYRSFYDSVKSLDDDKLQLELYNAVFEYSLYGREIDMSPLAKSMFILMKSNLDANMTRYSASIENGKKGGEYGFLGGRPRKESEEEKTPKKTPKKPLKALNTKPLNENVNVNENENENVNDNENENVINIAPSSFNENSSKLFIEIPLIDKTSFPIYESDLEKWSQLYPAPNMKDEFKAMVGWCISHPKNQKTKRGINAFINNWLHKAQNSAKPSQPYVLPQQSSANDIDTMSDDELARYINEVSK